MTFASLGLFLPKSFLGFFLTGSTQQLKNLREPPFCFQRADEVVQLRRNLVTEKNILPMQADEYICSLSSKDRVGGEIYYKDHSIYSAKKFTNGEVGVERLCHNRKVVEDAPELQFNYSMEQPGNHYVPQWAKSEEPIGSSLVALSSASNTQHRNISRLSAKKKESTFDFLSNRGLNVDDLQNLIVGGHYLVVPNLTEEASDYLDCSVTDLCGAMGVFRGAGGVGFTGGVNFSKFNGINGIIPAFGPRQLASLEENRVPKHDTDGLPIGFYKTDESAKMGVLLHILMNVGVVGKQPWTSKFFTQKSSPGFLLLVPTTVSQSTCAAVAFIYTDTAEEDQTTTKCSFIDDNGNGHHPFSIQ